MMSLLQRVLKNSTIKETAILKNSEFFNRTGFVPTPVPMINVALSGSVYGGISSGVTMLAGPSKHFKTGFALLMASSYLKAHPESILLFYDSEFGSPQSYFETFDIDVSRVVHTPCTTVEHLKIDMVTQLANLEKNDKMIVIIDSIGNLASMKELSDTLDQKTTVDMTRAKALKSFFRMITSTLVMKDIPLLAINHSKV